MEVSARSAGAEDEAFLSALRERARASVVGERGGSLYLAGELPRSFPAPEAGTAAPGTVSMTAVATIDGALVGFADAVITLLDGERTLCRLRGIYVEPEAREVGAGEALLDLVTSWAVRAGATGIDAPVLPGAREAKNFFESAGLSARLIVMHRRFGE